MFAARLLLAYSTLCALGGWGLSALGQLNRGGYAALMPLFLGWAVWIYRTDPPRWRKRGLRPGPACWSAARSWFILLWFLLAVAAILHPLTTWDSLAYRIPRVCAWLSESRWHWIHSVRQDLNCRACGFEWLSAPLLAGNAARWLFLPNLISFALLPGLTFRVLRQLGARRRAAYLWMWALPTGWVFALQAAGTGNDMIGLFYFLAALEGVLQFRRHGDERALGYSALAAAFLSSLKVTNAPLALAWAGVLLHTLYRRHERRTLLLLGGLAPICLSISCFPTLWTNHRHYGDWTGKVAEAYLMASDRTAALTGNTILLLAQNLAPPLLPGARQVDTWIHETAKRLFGAAFLRNFERGFDPWLGELRMEERAGLGLSLVLLAAWWLLRSKFRRASLAPAVIIALASLTAALLYMTSAGATTAARLLCLPCAGLLLALLPSAQMPFARRTVATGRWLLHVHFACVALVVVLHPSRPVLPVPQLISLLPEPWRQKPAVQKIATSFRDIASALQVYDPLRSFVPPQLPVLHTFTESLDREGQFWLRFEPRRIERIVDLADLDALAQKPGACLLMSDAAPAVRLGLTVAECRARLHAEELGTATLKLGNSVAPATWRVLRVGPPPH